MTEINVQYLDMPCKTHGLIRENEDGSVTIVLNSRDSRERNLRTYQHELEHLLREDLSAVDVQKAELEVHSKGGVE